MIKKVLIVIALKEEYSTFAKVFGHKFFKQKDYRNTFKCTKNIVDGESEAEIWVRCLNTMTSLEAASATSEMLEKISPDLVVSLGISGSLTPKNANLGDVVLGETCTEINYKGKHDGDSYRAGGDPFRSDNSLKKIFEGFSFEIDDILPLGNQVVIGPIATSTDVEASNRRVVEIKNINRNFLAVEMEAAGVARAKHSSDISCEFWVVKGISDLADENKTELEITSDGYYRSLAMKNASIVLWHSINSHIGLDDSHVVQLIQSELDEYYSRDKSATYSGLLNLSEDKKNEYISNLLKDCSFNEMKAYIEENPCDDFSIDGSPGSGVSAILLCLKYSLMKKGKNVLFVDLQKHTLDGSDSPILDKIRFLVAQVDYDAIIIDNWDVTQPIQQSFAKAFVEIPRFQDDKSIIYGGRISFTSYYGESGNLLLVDKHYRLQKLPMIWVKENMNLIKQIYNPVDESLFSLSLDQHFSDYIDPASLHYYSRSPVSQLSFVEMEINKKYKSILPRTPPGRYENIINRAARKAYQAFSLEFRPEKASAVSIETISSNKSNNEAAVLNIAFFNESVTHYLIAMHIINSFLSWEEGNSANEIPSVFPRSINKYCSLILEHNQEQQGHIVSVAPKILASNVHPYMKAHCCYMLGRVKSAQNIRDASDILSELIKNQIDIDSDDKPHLMIARTAYISLIYLRVDGWNSKYIDLLFEKWNWDSLNRGFHLEYYGDRDFQPKRPLESMDDLGAWDATFKSLMFRVNKNANLNVHAVDIHTLFSLAFERLCVGKLEKDKAVELGNFGKKLENTKWGNSRLSQFVSKTTACLNIFGEKGNTANPRAQIFSEIYSLQFLKRAGFSVRGLFFGQSIADHIFSAKAIARHYLPDRREIDTGDGYCKQRILELIEIHDYGEGRSGDYTPFDTDTQIKKLKEEKFFSDISIFLSKNEFYRESTTLWTEFRNNESINSLVAHDIDKIENYLCLKVMSALGFNPPDLDSWITAITCNYSPVGNDVLTAVQSDEEYLIQSIAESLFQKQPNILDVIKENIKNIEFSVLQ